MNHEATISTADTSRPEIPEIDDRNPDGETGKNRLYLWVVVALLIVAIVAAIAYFMVNRDDEAAIADEELTDQAQTITVITPGRTTITGEISASGSLSARREIPVGVVGEGGRVVSVTADEGEWVRAGQVLVAIDRSVQNQQVRSAAAQVDAARADARLAQANLDRALQLVDRGFISQADVDQLTSTRDAAVARVRVAQSQVRELQARNARLNIYAPTSGLVLERNVEKGQVVGAGSGALFRIAQGGEMELNAQLGESELAKVSVGVEAVVIPTGTDQEFTGQIWQIAPEINAQSRQGVARIALPYALALRPGGFATATIQGDSIVASILPESAVLSDHVGSYVYIVDKDNKAQRRRVTTGFVTSEGVTITDGLNGTEKVVMKAGGFLTEGETVNPKLSKKAGK